MNVTLVGQNSKTHSYPYVGISRKGRVVLFSGEGCGTLLKSPDTTYIIGSVDDNWDEDEFERMTGEIVLSND